MGVDEDEDVGDGGGEGEGRGQEGPGVGVCVEDYGQEGGRGFWRVVKKQVSVCVWCGCTL